MTAMHRSLFQISKRSRDQLKAHVLMYHHRLPSPDPSLVSNAASTKSLAFWRIANGMVPVSPMGTTGSLPKIDGLQGRISGRRVRIVLRRILLIKVVAAPAKIMFKYISKDV